VEVVKHHHYSQRQLGTGLQQQIFSLLFLFLVKSRGRDLFTVAGPWEFQAVGHTLATTGARA
jgi:hypothetical protein